MTVGHNNAPRITRILAAAILLALLLAVMGVPAAAVNNEGLLVETLCFRDVLRLYMLDKASFGENALAEDANGITNAAKRLAEMFDIRYTKALLRDKIPVVPAEACRCYFDRNVCDALIRKDKIAVMAEAISLIVFPSTNERTEISRPVMNSSMTTLSPDAPNFLSSMSSLTPAFASSYVLQIRTPLPSASPSALRTVGYLQVLMYS